MFADTTSPPSPPWQTGHGYRHPLLVALPSPAVTIHRVMMHSIAYFLKTLKERCGFINPVPVSCSAVPAPAIAVDELGKGTKARGPCDVVSITAGNSGGKRVVRHCGLRPEPAIPAGYESADRPKPQCRQNPGGQGRRLHPPGRRRVIYSGYRDGCSPVFWPRSLLPQPGHQLS